MGKEMLRHSQKPDPTITTKDKAVAMAVIMGKEMLKHSQKPDPTITTRGMAVAMAVIMGKEMLRHNQRLDTTITTIRGRGTGDIMAIMDKFKVSNVQSLEFSRNKSLYRSFF